MNRLLRVSVALSVSALFVMIAFGSAQALPAFSKKYGEACGFCHTVWPQLNRWGEDFKLNGYQAPKTMDGGSKNKNAQTNTWLDSGDANPPLAVRMQVKTTLYRQDTTEAPGAREDRRSFLHKDKASFDIFAGGTFTKNVGYFAEYDGAGGIGQGFVTINNIFGPGMLNVETGISNLNQFGVVTRHRNVIKVQKVVKFESKISGKAGSKLLSTGGDAPTIQVFGNPARGGFTYSLGIANANNSDATDDISTGGMLRWDFRSYNIAMSYNFEFGTQHLAGGEDANQFGTHLLGIKWDDGPMSVRGWYGYSTQDNYTFVSSNKVDNKRSGFGFDAWYAWESFEFGGGLDIDSESISGPTGSKLWTNTSGGNETTLSYMKFVLQTNYLFAENAKLGFLFQTGGYEDEYLKKTSGYKDDALLLTADLAF